MRRLAAAIATLAVVTACLGASPRVDVKFFTDGIVRITKLAADSAPARESVVVTAVPQDVKVRVSTKGDTTVYTTPQLTVKVHGGNVTFYNRAGDKLLAEAGHSFTPITDGIDCGSWKVKQSFAPDSAECIYGIGMLQNGKMSQRGEHRLMMQSNLEDYTNVFHSIKGYALYWDNYSPTRLDDDMHTLTLESQVGDRVDYYFVYGGDADGVISGIRHLTGHVPMVPMWIYGFHQSRERYKSQDELLEVVERYRRDSIPFDGIIQDWQYWGSNYTWNAMEFISPDFDRAQEMIDRVHDLNAHMSISIWSSFGPHTKPFAQLASQGLLLDFETWPESGLTPWPPRRDYLSGVRVYDCYSPAARDIYWNNLKRLHSMGIDGWWMDSTDPDHMQYKESDLDQPTAMGSYRAVRNLFPFMTVGGVDAHQRGEDSTKRVFIFTRSFYAGQQRYGAHTWSGDVGSSWEALRAQVPLCLNHTLTGNPNVNTDLGGFFAGRYNTGGGKDSGTRNPRFRELYTRWMQLGTFSPMMRSHGTEVPREIYYYGKPGEPVYDALLDAIRLRYRLMPYIYGTARQVSVNDDSFMRALFMDFGNDTLTWDNGRQFMFGRSIMACPVVDPLYTDEGTQMDDWTADIDWTAPRTWSVYLPAGTKWWDFHTGTQLDGGQSVDAAAPLAYCPVYIKAGSIIPMAPDMQYTAEKPWDNLTLAVYPGGDASFTLYEDEGDNYNYLVGRYTEIPLAWNDRTQTLTLGKRTGAYPGMLQERQFTVTLPDGTSRQVHYTGKKIKVTMK